MPVPRHRLLLLFLAVSRVPVAHAQSKSVTNASESITPPLIRRHIYVIADDSMLGRNTPSRGLELTAQYVADNFRRVGLKPAGDRGSFLQRYRIIRRKIDGDSSSVRFQIGAQSVTASLNQDARYFFGRRSGKPISGPAVLLGGPLDSLSASRADVANRTILVVGDFSKPLENFNRGISELLRHGPTSIVVVSNRETGLFALVVRRQFLEETNMESDVDDEPPAIEVHERALGAVLNAAKIDVTALRAAPSLVLRSVPELIVTVTVGDVPGNELSAPNTVGILEGTDSVLKQEYVVFSAHMDHVGMNPSSSRDSIWNGADDDASGTTGVMALAEAFAKAPPRRSVIFLTVSGEEKGLWGSEWFTSHPPVPIDRIVADINLDMIGRNWKDTIVVIGKEHSDLGATLNRVNALHPELGMSAIDDIWPQEGFYYRSDHFNFAKHGVPILFFFNGTHADYHAPSDSPDKIDAEKESRILKLVFYIGEEVANSASRPKWNPDSYRKIVK